MKTLLTSILAFVMLSAIQAQDAKEIVKKANDKMQGESNYSEMTMQIVRPKWTRSVSFKMCSKGNEFSMVLVTAPAKEKGQTFLKRENEMWSWNPKISRMIKLPPSMLSQGWMGSDYSNDDLLKEASIVVDYNHEIVGKETFDDHECYKIVLTPKEESVVVWGKQIKWITVDSNWQLKTEYYDEDEYLVKTELATNIKNMAGREIPTKFEIIPEDEPDHRTIIIMDKIVYNIQINERFFSQQNMKKGTAIRFPQ